MTENSAAQDRWDRGTANRLSVHRFVSMLRWDVALQIRYGLYSIYAVVVTLFITGLQFIPEAYQSIAVTAVIFGDPVFLGMYFIAALVLFEKGEGVLNAMITSSLQGTEYLISKAISLTILTVLASTVIAVFGHGSEIHVGWFLLAVGLTSMLFVLIGFVAVSRFDTLNSYFVSSLFYMLPFGIPLVTLLGVEHWALYLLPTHASILLIRAAFGVSQPVPGWELTYAIGYLLVWVIVAWGAAKRAFSRHIAESTNQGKGENAVAVPTTESGRDDRLGPTGMLLVSDLRNWFRDPLLLFVVILPIFYGVIGRVITPVVSEWLAPRYNLVAHYPLLTGFFVFIPPLTIGFVVGIHIIEEKEERILEALWTTPLSGRGYLIYRSISTIILSFVLMVVMVPLTGFIAVPVEVLLPTAAVGALWAVACALALPAFASNTIEGVAVSKFVGFSIMIPVFAIGILPEPVQYLSGIVPLYWPLKALTVGITDGSLVYLIRLLLVGIITQGIVIRYLLRRVNA